MTPHAVDIVCGLVNEEMEAAKPSLYMTTAQTTPEFIEGWDINTIMDPIAKDITPTWSSVLYAATEPKGSHDEQSRNRPTVSFINIISSQVHYTRSQNSCRVQIGLGLMASSTGASRNLMNVLQRCGLTTSPSSITTTISALAGFSIQQAAKISREPHAMTYDNMNMSSSIFVEQRPDAMSKVQSGSFTVLYKLPRRARLEHMRLAPMMENLKKAKPLKMSNLRASVEGSASYFSQSTVNISKIFLKSFPQLSDLGSDPLFQNKPRHQLPPGEKTRFYPVCTSTIEEASITGNLHVHDNVYVEQLKRDPKELNDYAIPCLNDQLTNSRIRSAQALRAKDITAWERREVFMLAFGTFHLLMNLIWALLDVHRGTISEHGSLAYYFNILEKVRLASEKPDFHTLLTALTQILEGLILNAWHEECGQPSLSDFAESNPKPEDIILIAQRIIKKYATPSSDIPKSDPPKNAKKSKKSKTSTDTDSEDEAEPPSPVDAVYENTILLTRDLLYVIELTDAIASGDFGRIEDILPDIACIFRGAGSNNYSTEILHLIFNIKEVWTPEFA
ncbi:hypothetical protein GALMADRAFT_93006 [Galerina marginata CBS 339.88]|uniref:DUF6589 domain-containing protein n=1 Tax=Galerina marginata (strain CBS 339.88) TaxID=685588 RepID=A0A067T7I1_GALM3|nr:hypothetical protein GALMADRAFT_93006 [Galerina marginata CBS 339.88]